ncbi:MULTISPECIES: hypothetical protein [unclassified Pseudodesulfovibrio]|uniref:hypothetical protein n=1 Tax=unclassified Pseudodesulfovibrio TaxID=2661612 RepID=UPI000FEB6601|nr:MULTISPECIES: hypothetical protein [unclassified Pseudodesulfovibrio]MCJ2163543.1 hypothetical protein [Pseudodesulfovibrio sp. S3-i]RWU06779.1 hypothetical protein DWB63_03170 [Pseudodesulfovibrio sp. S3]
MKKNINYYVVGKKGYWDKPNGFYGAAYTFRSPQRCEKGALATDACEGCDWFASVIYAYVIGYNAAGRKEYCVRMNWQYEYATLHHCEADEAWVSPQNKHMPSMEVFTTDEIDLFDELEHAILCGWVDFKENDNPLETYLEYLNPDKIKIMTVNEDGDLVYEGNHYFDFLDLMVECKLGF